MTSSFKGFCAANKWQKRFSKLRKFFLQYILRRKYIRSGSCNCCGDCCRQIYVKSAKDVIRDEEQFFELQRKHRFYKDLVLCGKDETGLIFACKNLDTAANRCKIHKFREKICRDYPREELFMMNGGLSEKCGFKFEPIVPFSKVLEKVSKKK